MTYEIIYDYDESRNISEMFYGSWTELQQEIKEMRASGCYNISAACISEED